MLLTDEQLMAESINGSLPAFELIVQRWDRRMLYFFIRCVGDREEAEDLKQELFIKIFQQRKQFRTSARFQPWLYRIATNLVIDKVVRKRRLETQSFDEDERIEQYMATDDTFATARQYASLNEIKEMLQQTLCQIPEEERVALILRHYENFTFPQIAELLNLPESTVKTRVYRAMQEMRKKLTRLGLIDADCLTKG